jgi:hypothetical protein
VNAKEYLEAVRDRREAWLALLAEVGERRMTLPELPGGWSVKDVIAHISWYESEMVELLRIKALHGSELWDLPTDERNIPIYEMNRTRSLEQVSNESDQVHAQLVALIESLGDMDLTDASRYADMPPDWTPLEVLAGNTYEHYDDHIVDIRSWLDRPD